MDKLISELNYEDLPPHLDELEIHFSSQNYKVKVTDEKKFPKVEEVFQEMKGMPINMELKDDSVDLRHKVAEMIKKYKREDITIWGNAHYHDEMKEEYPNIPTWASENNVRKTLYSYISLWLPFKELKFDTIQMPYINEELCRYYMKYYPGLKGRINLFLIKLSFYAFLPL